MGPTRDRGSRCFLAKQPRAFCAVGRARRIDEYESARHPRARPHGPSGEQVQLAPARVEDCRRVSERQTHVHGTLAAALIRLPRQTSGFGLNRGRMVARDVTCMNVREL